MEYRMFGSDCVVRLNKGEEVIEAVTELCRNENIKLASVTGIGAIDHAVLGLFRVSDKKYIKNTFDCNLEIASLVGNVSRKDGEVYLHFHAVVSDENGNAFGGHLSEAKISATAEIVLHIVDGEVGRRFDEDTGLNLLKF